MCISFQATNLQNTSGNPDSYRDQIRKIKSQITPKKEKFQKMKSTKFHSAHFWNLVLCIL